MVVQRPMLVATAGGHLTQLETFCARLGIDPATALWVSVATPQSRSLLAGRDVVWADYSTPRDLRALASHLLSAGRTLRRERISMAVSTGASLAPPFLAAGRARRLPCHYIESATRVRGPSRSGELVARIPGVHLYTQYESWADSRWKYRGSIFDGWQVRPRPEPRRIRRALVTVGSARGFPFRRMLDAARRALPDGCETTWQVLDTDGRGLPGRVVEELPVAELGRLVDSADVVISHAGTGSALTALARARCPVLIPRSARHGEHVDDHQSEIAAMLEARALAVVRSPETLTTDDLQRAADVEAHEVPGPRFELAT